MLPDEIHTWADVEVKVVSGSSLLVMPKSANKKWLSHALWTETCNTGSRASFIPWPGLPHPPKAIQSILWNFGWSIVSCSSLEVWTCFCIHPCVGGRARNVLVGKSSVAAPSAGTQSAGLCRETSSLRGNSDSGRRKMGGHAKSGKGKQF